MPLRLQIASFPVTRKGTQIRPDHAGIRSLGRAIAFDIPGFHTRLCTDHAFLFSPPWHSRWILLHSSHAFLVLFLFDFRSCLLSLRSGARRPPISRKGDCPRGVDEAPQPRLDHRRRHGLGRFLPLRPRFDHDSKPAATRR